MFKRGVRQFAERIGIVRAAERRPVSKAQFKQTIESLRGEIAAARARIDDLSSAEARLEALEFLAEHPDSIATSYQSDSFPSPAVSVVMPTWNREPLLGAAIRSVKAQTFTDWELFIVDDGSTDGTKQLIETFAADRRINYIRQDRLGPGAARNRALRAAKGALVAYLDSDNIWYPEFLSVAVAAFAAMPGVDCAYGANIRDTAPRIMHEPFDRQRLLKENYIDMSALIHRRSLVQRFGGFDERLQRLIDWDLVLRYTEHAPAYRLPVRAVRYREMDGMRITDTQPIDTEAAIIRAKWSAGGPPSPGQSRSS